MSINTRLCMIILTKLPENPGQAPSEEGMASQTQLPSSDSFSDILQASTDLNPESKKTSDSKPVKATEETVITTDPTPITMQSTAQPIIPDTNNVLLQQLNLL